MTWQERQDQLEPTYRMVQGIAPLMQFLGREGYVSASRAVVLLKLGILVGILCGSILADSGFLSSS